ncbi:DUF721 domain-containing protein [Luteimonas sp. 50]|uniref:DUF721 domain-containing protein n=1 Tax=Cognatiluteimonas sedimenti TaxID=2927791 RepID=A0ABT0A433_9GAMM|nr:DciA family protein [Lysobacter sedimenti]MCJ0825695.1 DUF721 domain-containing protein [Lysobacter sedimenti]
MSGSRSGSSKPPGPRAPAPPRNALDALFAGGAADPLRRALWLDALEQRLRPHLPPSLAAHARFANVDGAKLVFVVDSPVWHARLRLAAPALLDAARSVGLECGEVVVKTTTVPLSPDPPAPRRPLPIPAAAREALQAALAPKDVPDGTKKNDS